MKRFASLLLALALAVTTHAQSSWSPPSYNWGSGWCATCYLHMHVDIPNSGTGWTGYLHGWGFWGESGALISHFDVYYQNGGPLHRANAYIITGLDRPDVQAYFLGAGYPNAPGNSGWGIYFHEPIPSGTWTLSVVLWHGHVSTTQTGTVTVP